MLFSAGLEARLYVSQDGRRYIFRPGIIDGVVSPVLVMGVSTVLAMVDFSKRIIVSPCPLPKTLKTPLSLSASESPPPNPDSRNEHENESSGDCP
jgi:hypothetical protein